MNAIRIQSSEEINELLEVLKETLSDKVDVDTYRDLNSEDAVATIIAIALTDYSNTKGSEERIRDSLIDCLIADNIVMPIIDDDLSKYWSKDELKIMTAEELKEIMK